MPVQWAYTMAFVAFSIAVFSRALNAVKQGIRAHRQKIAQPFDDAERSINELRKALAHAEAEERTLMTKVSQIYQTMHEEILALQEETHNECHAISVYYRNLQQQHCHILLAEQQKKAQALMMTYIKKHMAQEQHTKSISEEVFAAFDAQLQCLHQR